MKVIQAAIQISPIGKYLDILSMVMGGFMYLTSPVFIERLIDGLLWFIPSTVARLIDLYVDLNKDTMNETSKVFLTIGSLLLSSASWAYIMAPRFGINWGLVYKYSDRYEFLGAAIETWFLNTGSSLFSTTLDWTPVKNLVLNKFPEIKSIYPALLKIVNYLPKVIAAIITIRLSFETMEKHFNQQDEVWIGDFFFLLQAGIIHFFISLDKLIGLLNWLWSLLGLTLESKRARVLFGVNAVLDALMLGIFLFVT
jgi:hypothetical protein